ncbi:MAG: hypothetical protein ACI8QC_002598 [Planctomycetota bacterium]|jgi:hypothetical protein
MAGSLKHLGIPPHEWRAEYLRKIELLSGGVAHACTPLPETASPTQPALNRSHWKVIDTASVKLLVLAGF